MIGRALRKNERMLGWLKATSIAAATYAALLGMEFAPGWGAALLALAAGGLALAATDLGILTALTAVSLPLMASDAVVGVTFLVLGVIGIRYLGADGGQVFFVVAAAVAGAWFGPAWAAVVLAGLLMGSGEGALAAAIACLAVEALGLALGKPTLGPLVAGGAADTALVSFAKAPDNLFAAEWLRQSFGNLGTDSVDRIVGAVAGARDVTALVVQPIAWAIGAAVAGSLSAAKGSRPHLTQYTGLAAGIGIVAAAQGVVTAFIGGKVMTASLFAAAALSLVVAAAFAWVWQRTFPLQLVAAAVAPRTATMAAEDADVDELLRLISTAEEKLTTQHTTHKTVMITDMKSFSRMTEEDGSMLTAKAIQKHRDLLLPIIERHGGHGKSTGGDGLVASFATPADALLAAAEMQQALAHHNENHPEQREMTVRIGIAEGEVILDKGGRPFIGAALNLAARVMNLADGGQAFATAGVSSKGGAVVRTHSHGSFELRNIAEPVEVVEVLYADGQQPIDPRERLSA